MAGCNQSAAWFAQWRRDGKPEWRQQFIRVGPWSNKVMCIECGSTGFMGLDYPHGWQVGCLIGHQTCDVCGNKARNVGSHKWCKLHHQTCCQHLSTNGGRLKMRLRSTALEKV